MKDHRVIAIRECPVVGIGSCSSIDECFSNKELIDMLNEENIKSKKDAKKWALDRELLWLEQGLNCRWGEDDDPQLLMWQDFKKRVKLNYPHHKI